MITSIQDNVAALSAALARVKDHPMCAKFSETEGHFLILFPPGFRLDGVRVAKAMGKALALDAALAKMELYWKLA